MHEVGALRSYDKHFVSVVKKNEAFCRSRSFGKDRFEAAKLIVKWTFHQRKDYGIATSNEKNDIYKLSVIFTF